MPITSPSYFPPSRANGTVVGITAGNNATGAANFLAGKAAGTNATVADLIVIGDSSGNGGITGADLEGALIVGAGSLSALTVGNGNATPVTALGSDIAPILVAGDSSVLVGSAILTNYLGNAGGPIQQCVMIGNKIMPLNTGISSSTQTSVLIGYNIMPNSNGFGGVQSSVVIGDGMLTGLNPNAGLSLSVIIGHFAGNNIGVGSSASNVIIGSSASTLGQGGNNVVVGSNAGQSGAGTSDANNVIIGVSGNTTGSLNTVVGPSATTAHNNANFGSISIGCQAGSTLAATRTNVLVIESSTAVGGGSGNTPSALVFGDFLKGNIVFGNSLEGTNRDFGGVPGTNMVKLLNGTAAGGAAIIGGGYFYVAAGILHWVDSASNDLNFNGAVATGASTASFVSTNKPGATTGVGPATWMNAVVNGTSYQIPLWAT